MSAFTEKLKQMTAAIEGQEPDAGFMVIQRDSLLRAALPQIIEALEAADNFEKDSENKFKRNILWHKLDALDELAK